MLAASIILAALGLLLLVLGLRGRRVGDAPHCSGCGFDLTGLCGRARLCPECATELDVHAVVRGKRRRRRTLLAAASVLLLLGGAGTAVIGWGRTTKYDWNRAKPLWLLCRELARPEPSSHAAAAELLRRHGAGEIPPAAWETIAEAILPRLGEGVQPWPNTWIYLLQGAWPHIGIEQQLRLLQPAVEWRLEIPKQTRSGESVDVLLSLSMRYGRAVADVYPRVSMDVRQANWNGTAIHAEQWSNQDSQIGPRLRAGRHVRFEVGEHPRGPHRLDVQWIITLRHEDSELSWPVASTSEIWIAPRGPLPRAIDDSRGMLQPVVDALSTEGITFSHPRPGVPPSAGVKFVFRSTTFDPALGEEFTVHARDESGREWLIGHLRLGDEESGHGQWLPGFRGKSVLIILRPADPDIPGEIIAGELELRKPFSPD